VQRGSDACYWRKSPAATLPAAGSFSSADGISKHAQYGRASGSSHFRSAPVAGWLVSR
jgi:hypothetical protein